MNKDYEYIDHPAHYGGKNNPYETIEIIYHRHGDSGVLALAEKHLGRLGTKPGDEPLQDLKKAVWYLNFLINKLESTNP